MRIVLPFALLLLFSALSFGQCPIDVQIVASPDATTIEVCKGDSVRLEANPSAGALTPSYIWVINGDTIATTDSVIDLLANSQNVQVYMATTTGCPQDTVSTTIQIQTVMIQNNVAILDSKCNPETADIQITSSGGTAPYSYNLVGVDTSSTGYYQDVPAGTYTLYVTDSAGCNDTDQIVITPIPPDITTDAAALIETCNQTTADILASSSGGSAPYTYELVGQGTNTSGTWEEVVAGTYVLYVTDADGCIDTAEVSVDPYTCTPPRPIEVITPNEDGYFDTWIIRDIEHYDDNEVFIYDRWGQRVYHKKGYDNSEGWDAKYIGANMPVSTYYYIIKYTSNQDEEMTLTGPISVFR